MLRKLMIRFKTDGDYFREIDEDRNYFLAEAEEIVEKIRLRLAKEKREVATKPFEFWIDGQLAVISHVYFEKKESLEKQLEQTISKFDSWDEDVRYKMINHLKEYAEEERQLFLNREFHAFAIRYDQLFGQPSQEPFPVLLDILHLNQLYVEVQKHVSTGFYSELERVMLAIRTAIEKVIDDGHQRESVQVQTDFKKKQSELHEVICEILEDEQNYKSFIQYVVASFQSVAKSRIEALSPGFLPYQQLQQDLFKEVAKKMGFKKAYELHSNVQKALMEKYDMILTQGFALSNDEMVESLVLSPVVRSFKEQVKILIDSEVEANDREAILDLS